MVGCALYTGSECSKGQIGWALLNANPFQLHEAMVPSEVVQPLPPS